MWQKWRFHFKRKTWRCRGSNPGPFTCKANALPLSHIPLLSYPLNPVVDYITQTHEKKDCDWNNTRVSVRLQHVICGQCRHTYPLKVFQPASGHRCCCYVALVNRWLGIKRFHAQSTHGCYILLHVIVSDRRFTYPLWRWKQNNSYRQ